MQLKFQIRSTSGNAKREAAVRQFQSETDAIREAPEPLTARITTALLAAFVVSLVALTVFAYAEHGDQPERQAARQGNEAAARRLEQLG